MVFKRSILHMLKIIRFEQIHIQIVLLVSDDQKVNFEKNFTLFGPRGQFTLNFKEALQRIQFTINEGVQFRG